MEGFCLLCTYGQLSTLRLRFVLATHSSQVNDIFHVVYPSEKKLSF